MRGTRARVPELFSVFGSGGVGGGYALFWCVLHCFSHSKRPLIYILDIIRRYQKTRGTGARFLDLFTVFGLGGVGGEHALFRCVLHHFLQSNWLITSIIGPIQRYQKVRGMRNRVPEIFSTYSLGGVGGGHDPFQ